MYIWILIALMLPALNACFQEDAMVRPHLPGDELSFELKESMYTVQSFFDLDGNQVVSSSPNPSWMLGFACGISQWHIIVNSSDYLGIMKTGTRDFSLAAGVETGGTEQWHFDRSDGNPDSTAIGAWVEFTAADTAYSGEVYLLGQYDGIEYSPLWMLKFTHVDDSSYQYLYARYGQFDTVSVSVVKDSAYNFVYYQFSDSARQVMHEPPKDQWDLLFSQYGSILYTNEGVPTPYFVRGVLLNPNGVSAAIDTARDFSDITFDSLPNYSFSTDQDAIGYEWKDVEVDAGSNTAVYTVKSGNNYLIRDTNGFYYKLRFVSFYNELGEKGFPVFEFLRL